MATALAFLALFLYIIPCTRKGGIKDHLRAMRDGPFFYLKEYNVSNEIKLTCQGPKRFLKRSEFDTFKNVGNRRLF